MVDVLSVHVHCRQTPCALALVAVAHLTHPWLSFVIALRLMRTCVIACVAAVLQDSSAAWRGHPG